MGVLNTTPDSFSDGGHIYRDGRLDVTAALAAASAMVDAGAGVIDVGGESTRPGAEPVSEQVEMDRVLPVVERLAASVDAIISVDTSSPSVMREAAALGAGLLNDVRALTRDGALEAARDTGLPICLMHMQGSPTTMQAAPRYDDVVDEVLVYLRARVAACEAAGILRDRLLLDPGFGFGKSVAHNLRLLAHLPRLAGEGLPLLIGLSRKSLIGALTGREVDERMPASVALALLAVQRGASIVRVHDVAATADALAMWAALENVEA
ncbi:MAG: dihydropteroate synthase [Chromatocurvus sp.]